MAPCFALVEQHKPKSIIAETIFKATLARGVALTTGWSLTETTTSTLPPGHAAPRCPAGKPARMVEFGRMNVVYCLYT